MKRHPETLALAMDYAAAMEAAAAYVEVARPAVRVPEDAYRLVRPLMDAATGNDSQEAFFVILVNIKNRAIGAPRECARGLLDSCPVHPRNIFRDAIRENASCVILAHNHPSGDPTPSKEDIDITRRFVESGKIIGIRILDHIICGRPSPDFPTPFISLREKALLEFP